MNLEDLKARMQRKAEEVRKQRFNVARARQMEGQAASELMADPKWELWSKYIEAEREKHEQLYKTGFEKLLSSRISINLDMFTQAKTELAVHQAWAEALQFSIQIAKSLVERGEIAEQEVKQYENRTT